MSKRFSVILADPPWSFDDTLTMSTVARGARSNYDVMTDREIELLGHSIYVLCERNSCCALWCPSSKLPAGLRVMAGWGFEFKTTVVWDKKLAKGAQAFGMGHYFRAAHELALFGVRGTYRPTGSKSERSLFEAVAQEHSRKPGNLHESLERMYPGAQCLELFARCTRLGWTCLGNSCPATAGEDIRDSLKRLSEAA